MLNLIKMDVYRMLHTKSMYVIAIVFVVFIGFSTMMEKVDIDYAEKELKKQETTQEEVVQEDENQPVNIGMSVQAVTKPGAKVTLQDMVFSNIQGKVLSLFIVIFAILFATADVKSGYIKNIGGIVYQRENLVLSKAVAMFLYVFGMFALFLLVQSISDAVLFGYFRLGNAGQMFRYLAAEFLLHYTFALICMGLAIVLKSNAFSMAIAICLTMNVMSVVYVLLDRIVAKIGVKDFQTMEHTVTGKIAMLPYKINSKEMGLAVLTAIAFGAVSTMVTCLIFRKRDI